MAIIDASTLSALPLGRISEVTFYKLDEITCDLICCEVMVGEQRLAFNENMLGWKLLLKHVEKLPNFRSDWLSAVSKPACEPCETVAFRRHTGR